MSDAMPIYLGETPFDALEPFNARAPEMRAAERFPHEDARIHAIVDALPDPRYADALGVGVNGGLRLKLAERCARLGVVRLNEQSGKTTPPALLPAGQFNLIVLVDVLSFADEAVLDRLAAQTAEALAPEGHVVLAHWLRDKGARMAGDVAASRFVSRAGDNVQPILRRRTPHYRLDVLERV